MQGLVKFETISAALLYIYIYIYIYGGGEWVVMKMGCDWEIAMSVVGGYWVQNSCGAEW